jgi:pyruvate/2-oxoglutarate dehydrogenase complex dihydrolipoamide dehydrogenase (E3) component
VKIIRGLPRGEILGAHIMGDQATELIAELSWRGGSKPRPRSSS